MLSSNQLERVNERRTHESPAFEAMILEDTRSARKKSANSISIWLNARIVLTWHNLDRCRQLIKTAPVLRLQPVSVNAGKILLRHGNLPTRSSKHGS
jgi:hypothetical protein